MHTVVTVGIPAHLPSEGPRWSSAASATPPWSSWARAGPQLGVRALRLVEGGGRRASGWRTWSSGSGTPASMSPRCPVSAPKGLATSVLVVPADYEDRVSGTVLRVTSRLTSSDRLDELFERLGAIEADS